LASAKFGTLLQYVQEGNVKMNRMMLSLSVTITWIVEAISGGPTLASTTDTQIFQFGRPDGT
jgi:hypothetical protein